MQAPDPKRAREFAVKVVQKLRDAGFEALWAGGCVRDQLLGKRPKDYDVATNAVPNQIRDLFGRKRTFAVGAAFGVMTVVGPKPAGQIEVATFRQDAGYSDGRRPDAVVFSDAREDALRRDFTINGLFFDPLTDEIHDYVGGREDLERKVVRAIRDPDERFAEDKLRLLRAIRFCAVLEFSIEAETKAALIRRADELTIVSPERIAAELRRMLVDTHRAYAMELMLETGLLPNILPETVPNRDEASGARWQPTLQLLRQLDQPTFGIALAATLREHVLGAGAAEANAKRIVEGAGDRLRLAKKEAVEAAYCLAHEELIVAADRLPWSRVQPILLNPHAESAVRFAAAVARAGGESVAGAEYCLQKLELPAEQLDPPHLVSGADLKAAGIPPGPKYREWLQYIRDRRLDGEISTRDEAIAALKRLLDD